MNRRWIWVFAVAGLLAYVCSGLVNFTLNVKVVDGREVSDGR